MRKPLKVLLLAAMVLAALLLCACQGVTYRSDLTINSDGSGSRAIHAIIPKQNAEGGERIAYYYLTKHGDDLQAWLVNNYTLNVPGSEDWLEIAVDDSAEACEVITLTFSFANQAEYMTRLRALAYDADSSAEYVDPIITVEDDKITQYEESAEVAASILDSLEVSVTADSAIFDLKAVTPGGKKVNPSNYDLTQIRADGFGVEVVAHATEDCLFVSVDGQEPQGVRPMQGTFTFRPDGNIDPTKMPLKVTKADEWTALFERLNCSEITWLAADGIFGMALDGNDAFGSATEQTSTFFIFSDTLVGRSDENGARIPGTDYYMPSHTAAVLQGNVPNKENISFYWGQDGACSTSHNNLSSTKRKNLVERYKWFGDGVVVDGNLHLFCYSPAETFANNIDMATFPIVDGMPDFANYSFRERIPELYITLPDSDQYALFGYAVTAMTESAGAPNPDGYIYIYGKWSGDDRIMCVCRIPEEHFPDFSHVTYWTGDGWSENKMDTARIPTATGISEEFSVTPITVGPHKGRYILVYMDGSVSGNIMYALSDTPWGPFDEPQIVLCTPENEDSTLVQTEGCWTYQAKAYPHLSYDDKLLISYNINTFNNTYQDNFTYRPRFIWLDLDPTNDKEETQQ